MQEKRLFLLLLKCPNTDNKKTLHNYLNPRSKKNFLDVLPFYHKFQAVTSSTTSSRKTYPDGMVISIVLTDTFIILRYHAVIEFISNI